MGYGASCTEAVNASFSLWATLCINVMNNLLCFYNGELNSVTMPIVKVIDVMVLFV